MRIKALSEAERICNMPTGAQAFIDSLYVEMTQTVERVDGFVEANNLFGAKFNCIHRNCLPHQAASAITHLEDPHRFVGFGYRSLQTAAALDDPHLAFQIDTSIASHFGRGVTRQGLIWFANRARRIKSVKLHPGYMYLPHIYDRLVFGRFESQCVGVYNLQNGRNNVICIDEKSVPVNPGFDQFETFMIIMLSGFFFRHQNEYALHNRKVRFKTVICEVEFPKKKPVIN